jgi:predicted extracellular nuclease
MMIPRIHLAVRRLSMAALAVAALSVMTIAVGRLHAAAATELFFSEYVEGSSNNKALEIYNGTAAAVDLAGGGYNVQMFFNGNPAATLTINLTGTVAAGDVYVLAQSSATAAILAQADQTNVAGWFNGDDAVVLRRGTTIIDAIGQAGVDPGTEWGGGLVSTADNTLRRSSSVCAGETIHNDPFDPATAGWEGFATDTFNGLGAHTSDCAADAAPLVTGTFPVDGASDFPTGANLTVTFSEPVDAAPPWFTLTCSTAGPVAASVSGGPTTFTLDPDVDLTHGDACTLTVLANRISDADANDPPDRMDVNFTVGFSPFDACAAPFTPIPQIQGSGPGAAITGTVTTMGVVVGDFEGPTSTGLQGFYLQDAGGDGNELTSDGIFVFTGNASQVAAGETVRVTGFARERFNQTTLNGGNDNNSPVSAGSIVHCGAAPAPSPVDVMLPFENAGFPERFEGMLVRLPQSLVISEYFNLERFGEIVLALPLDGETRPFTPTAVEQPGAPAQARALANSLSRITLDDGLGTQNPAVIRHPNGSAFNLGNRFRGGDTVQNTVGVVGFDFSVYRIQPTAPAVYTPVNPRPDAPDAVDGAITVGAMNTLNFFLTPDYPAGHPLDNTCGPSRDFECRGADADQPLEFQRQRDKLLAALAGLEADIIGLNEIENTPGVDPLGDPASGIVAGLNSLPDVEPYGHIDTGVIGTDAIRVGLIYRPARVTPVGGFAVLDSSVDPRFIDTKSRPALAQTFVDNSNGARFTVVVNHLKSKGSDCVDVSDPDVGDGQGNCNLTRLAAAQALVDWLAVDPTGSGDADFLIMGDLNSYAKEDPVVAIEAGADGAPGTPDDYTNLIAKYQGKFAYSYVFDGQFGYLDHALASVTLAAQVAGAGDWHINADEPDVLDYDTSFKPASQDAIYEPNAYRSSDHDAVRVGVVPRHYTFSGFSGLIHDAPGFNSANAGSSMPLKFSLGGDQGLDVFAGGYPRSHQIACDSAAPLGDSRPTSGPGGSSLSYDPESGEYNYVWKTDRAWSGTCRQLVVILKDGAVHYANVWFK